MMQRMGMVIGLKPEAIAEYKKLHADVWPEVLDRLKQSSISNYSIFLREPENLMFSYWEYTGSDFDADMAAIAADELTQKWWSVCGPMQAPLTTRAEGEWWAAMDQVFYLE
jgi:L-rhamnose mutarotase